MESTSNHTSNRTCATWKGKFTTLFSISTDTFMNAFLQYQQAIEYITVESASVCCDDFLGLSLTCGDGSFVDGGKHTTEYFLITKNVS